MGKSNNASGSQESVFSVPAQAFISQNTLTFMSSYDNKRKFILLSTAVCSLCDGSGKEFKLRCLLEFGSFSSFISRNCVELM